eukprot:CAMPEP_0174264246 /NCGR_PEP_ID=MMETSP0439-20130205/21823_1 /TAXON_ID=0 /ORGANISM="Stereomyxa ramosa, Strain Chinc5" /LENGTH=271 /DNA_ID=CAMNT_0015350033 /DNA_START=343 /DNA_END=1158 /DNA_ORIENTATION=+
MSHELIRDRNYGLDAENFNNTKGFMVRFNRGGLEKLRKREDFTELLEYFDRVRVPEANAFVLNLLICNPKPKASAGTRRLAVGNHYDNTAAINSKHEFYAHEVDVFYLQVPKDTKGGVLEVFPPKKGRESGMEAVVPTENMLVAFRGDSSHQITEFSTDLDEPRISLVLEQYIIPDQFTPNLVSLLFDDGSFHFDWDVASHHVMVGVLLPMVPIFSILLPFTFLSLFLLPSEINLTGLFLGCFVTTAIVVVALYDLVVNLEESAILTVFID